MSFKDPLDELVFNAEAQEAVARAAYEWARQNKDRPLTEDELTAFRCGYAFGALWGSREVLKVLKG